MHSGARLEVDLGPVQGELWTQPPAGLAVPNFWQEVGPSSRHNIGCLL